MRCDSRLKRALSLLAAALVCAAAADAPAATSVAQASSAVDLKAVHYWRLFTGPDGETHTERLEWPAHALDELGSSTGIVQFYSAAASSAIVISGKPGWVSPMHSVGDGRELVLVMKGLSIGHFSDGHSQMFVPGDIVLLEDRGSKGRAVEFGALGYVGLTIPLAAEPPPAK